MRPEGLESMTLPSISLLWEEEVPVELLFIGTRKDIICNQDIVHWYEKGYNLQSGHFHKDRGGFY